MHAATPRGLPPAGRLALLVLAVVLLPLVPGRAQPPSRKADDAANVQERPAAPAAVKSGDDEPLTMEARPRTLPVGGEGRPENSFPLLSIACSPDGRTLAVSGEEKTVQLLDAASGRLLRLLGGHTDVVGRVAFSPDGKTLASACFDHTLKLWDVATGAERFTLKSHTNWVFSVAFSPDGKTLASGGYDRTVRLWDVATGRSLAVLKGHRGGVRGVAFSPDGKTLASGSSDRTIKLWDVATRELMATLKGHDGAVRCVAFAPDGRALASGGEDNMVRLWDVTAAQPAGAPPPKGDKVRLWDPVSGKQIASFQMGDLVLTLAYSPRGAMLACAGQDLTIRILDPVSGRQRTLLRGHNDAVTCLCFTPDGRSLFTGSADKTIKHWPAARPPLRPVAVVRAHGNQTWVALLMADGKGLITAGADGTVKIQPRSQVGTDVVLQTPTGFAYALAFSPGGKILAVGSGDHSIKLFETRHRQTVIHASRPCQLGLEPGLLGGRQETGLGRRRLADQGRTRRGQGLGSGDGRRGGFVPGAHGRRLRRRLVPRRQDAGLGQLGPDAAPVGRDHGQGASAPGGAHEGGALGRLRARRQAAGQRRLRWRGPSVGPGERQASGRAAHAGGGDQRRRFRAGWQDPRRLLQPLYRARRQPRGRLGRSARRRAAVGRGRSQGDSATARDTNQSSVAGLLRRWQEARQRWRTFLASASAVRRGQGMGRRFGALLADLPAPRYWVEAVAFSPDSRTVAASGGTTGLPSDVNLWDLTAWRNRRILTLKGHTRIVACAAVSPDGKVLATGSSDKTIRLWDLAGGKEVALLNGHEDMVRCLAFAPDGKTLASASTDKTVRLWDVAAGKEKAVLARFEVGAAGVAFSSDGKLLAMCASDDRNARLPGGIKLWDLSANVERTPFAGANVSALSVAFSPDGKLLASASPTSPSVHVWSVADGKRVTTIQESASVRHLAFSPDGKLLATGHGGGARRGDGSVQLWDTTTWKEIAFGQAHRALVVSVAFSSDGRTLATASMDGTAMLWDLKAARAVARKDR